MLLRSLELNFENFSALVEESLLELSALGETYWILSPVEYLFENLSMIVDFGLIDRDVSLLAI